ncbi:MAG TPA: sigma-70 family RNA polymerase sigma factor [Terriglobales bacterium]|jgi:RNA polymerase sigma-70 factor (ECF subfamily)|nr:sigma-70 family RNA polymerase sigma factor [Terriglobales bacterium]
MTDAAQPVVEISQGLASLVAGLYTKSGAVDYQLSREQFGGILDEIAAKYQPSGSTFDLRELYSSLRIEDLALARACAMGNEHAWEVFLTRFRVKLYDIAGYIAREASAARELADGIYGDLYGTTARDGQRVSKLASYTGRGSLEGWLRTVMAQEFVNKYRRQRKLVSLDGEEEDGTQFVAKNEAPPATVDPRLEAATGEALASLAPDDRFVLASYYLDRCTLADIARTLSVHESTISRKLDKLAKALRKQILNNLGQKGMSRRQSEEALDADVRDLQLNIRKHLTQKTEIATFPDKKGPASEGKD